MLGNGGEGRRPVNGDRGTAVGGKKGNCCITSLMITQLSLNLKWIGKILHNAGGK